MNEDPFVSSLLAGGKHHELSAIVGTWEGTTKTWFEPGNLANESPTKATIRPLLDGRFLLYEYSGTLMGRSMHGMMIVGYNLQTGSYQSAWIDNLHMGTGIMCSEGHGQWPAFNVLGGYDDPSGGPSWGWETEFRLTEDRQLIITAFNIPPEGDKAKAIETIYRRVDHRVI